MNISAEHFIIAGDFNVDLSHPGPNCSNLSAFMYQTISFLLIRSLALTLPTIMMIIHAFPLLITFLLNLTMLISLILFLFLTLLIISQTTYPYTPFSSFLIFSHFHLMHVPPHTVNNCYTSGHPHSPANSAINWFKVTPCDVSSYRDHLLSTLPADLLNCCDPDCTRCYTNPGSLEARNGECVFCTDTAITFLGSPYPLLPFDKNIALVHSGTLKVGSPQFSQISFVDPIRRYMNPGSLEARTAEFVFCTDTAITILSSPYP